ncbi:MAG: hypothetical protein RR239_03360 [Oscillospiraceae bacterium]
MYYGVYISIYIDMADEYIRRKFTDVKIFKQLNIIKKGEIMIGLGKWVCTIDTIWFKSDIYITISNKNGEYDFEINAPHRETPNYNIKDLVTTGNTLTATIYADALSGKGVPISLTFYETTFTGFFIAPYVGRIELENGKRIG